MGVGLKKLFGGLFDDLADVGVGGEGLFGVERVGLGVGFLEFFAWVVFKVTDFQILH